MLIDNILDLETEELLNHRFTKYNFLIWPFIRAQIYNDIYLKITNSLTPSSHRENLSLKENMAYIYNTFKYSPFKYSHLPIVFIVTQIAATAKKNGKYFNRLHDYFALEYPYFTLMIEKSERRKYKLPRYFDNIAFEDFIYIKPYSKSISKLLFKNFHNKDIIHINNFLEYLKKIFKKHIESINLDNIYKKLLNYSVLSPLLYENYTKLFEKLVPSIVFIYAASGGKNKTHITKAAKDMGIKVAEFQHGAITYSHPFYNFSNKIFNSLEYKKYLPDYLLTWGKFWSDNMRHPSKKFEIGNPHFITMMEKYKRIKSYKISEKNIILVVSQGTLTKVFVEIVKELSKKLSNDKYKIIFRLHPGEVPFEERYKELYSFSNVEINKTGDIYDLIFNSDYIVACYSTVIFEVLGFKKPIFIIDNQWSREYIPKEIGNWFEKVDELYQLIISNKTQENKINNSEYYWDPNWQKNYKDFIENELYIKK
jgi:hypothetical protein